MNKGFPDYTNKLMNILDILLSSENYIPFGNLFLLLAHIPLNSIPNTYVVGMLDYHKLKCSHFNIRFVLK